MEKPFVLLADDNEATCTLITALLQRDFAVDIAKDGHDAIEKLKRRQYAVVLLDLLMPLADGYAVLDFLREQRPDMLPRVVILTAAISRREMQRVREYDVAGVIAKPFEVDQLYAKVRELAGLSDGPSFRGGPLLSSGMILLISELLRRVP